MCTTGSLLPCVGSGCCRTTAFCRGHSLAWSGVPQVDTSQRYPSGIQLARLRSLLTNFSSLKQRATLRANANILLSDALGPRRLSLSSIYSLHICYWTIRRNASIFATRSPTRGTTGRFATHKSHPGATWRTEPTLALQCRCFDSRTRAGGVHPGAQVRCPSDVSMLMSPVARPGTSLVASKPPNSN
jgi:hypothetical protein